MHWRNTARTKAKSAENAHHTIPEAVEPWILEMSLSGGSAFSQLRDKLDSTHTANYRGQEIPLRAGSKKDIIFRPKKKR